MKKYICPNCGFLTRFKTRKIEYQRRCKNCTAQVYSSTAVLESVLMTDIKLNTTKI